VGDVGGDVYLGILVVDDMGEVAWGFVVVDVGDVGGDVYLGILVVNDMGEVASSSST